MNEASPKKKKQQQKCHTNKHSSPPHTHTDSFTHFVLFHWMIYVGNPLAGCASSGYFLPS
jgi:hypothetical protein